VGKCTKFYLKKPYKVHKRTAILRLKKPNQISSIPPFNTLGWHTFDNILKYITAVLVYKAFINQAPKYISDLLVNSSLRKYYLRSTTLGDIITKSKIANTKNLFNTLSNKGKNY